MPVGERGGSALAHPETQRYSASARPRPKDCEPAAIFTETGFLGHISALLPDAYQGAIAATDGNFDCARIVQSLIVSEPDVAVLQYTSGSTSKPKGVVLCNANIFANLRQIEVAFGHTCESSGVIWLPHYHDMGLIGGILQPLFAGFPVTLLSPISFIQRPLRWLQAIHKYRATTSGGPNFAYDLCVKKAASLESHIDLSSWDLAFNGAEPVRASTLNAFSAAFAHAGFRRTAFVPCYGLAEATLIVSAARKNREPLIIESSDPQLTTHGVNVLAGGNWFHAAHLQKAHALIFCAPIPKRAAWKEKSERYSLPVQALQTDIGEERPGVPTWLA